MKVLLTTLCLTTLCSVANALDKPAAIELKDKSKFSASEARNPFWPIGWKKPSANDHAAPAGPELTAASFNLSSVTMGTSQHFAILNGKIMQEGQVFGLQFGSQVYQVTLKQIEDGQVVLTTGSSEIVVPLHRK